MKKILPKKIVAGVLMLFIVFTTSFSAYPKKAEAQWAVFDIPNLATNVLNGVASFASSALDSAENIKEYVLDPLVTGLAEMMLQALTQSVVDWINGGFEGSPAFVQNPGAFFLDLADQATGQFIQGDLAELCSPFSIDIRIALSFKYRPYVKKRYACTLGTIIANSQNAIKNASINGFTAGDFKQGGWPAFVSLTTEPQNNVFGAYLEAESDLSFRVASKQFQATNELNQGKGFLSWKKCRPTYASGSAAFEDDPSASTEETCEIQTPGTVIADSLQKQLDIPVEKLGLADEIGEIVNALFAQVVSQVLQKGLTSVSQPDSTGKSYLDKVVNDVNNQKKAGAIGSKLKGNIDAYVKLTQRYLDNRASAYGVVANIKATYDATVNCYEAKLASSTPALSTVDADLARTRIADIQSKFASTTAFYSTLVTTYTNFLSAQTTHQEVVTAKDQATNATSLEEVQKAADVISRITDPNNTDRLDERDVDQAYKNYTKILGDTKATKTEADDLYGQCQGFPTTP